MLPTCRNRPYAWLGERVGQWPATGSVGKLSIFDALVYYHDGGQTEGNEGEFSALIRTVTARGSPTTLVATIEQWNHRVIGNPISS